MNEMHDMHDMKCACTGRDSSKNMKMDNMDGMNMPQSGDIVTLNYAMLRSTIKTILPDAAN